MSIKNEYSKQLEAYFSGEMTGADRLVFEGRVESDPMLKTEFENQQDIINTLRVRRSTELKARLGSIPVEPTLIGALLQSSFVKPVIYGLTSLSMVTGTYMFYNTESATSYHIESVEGKTSYLTASQLNLEFGEKLELLYIKKEVDKEVDVVGSIDEDPMVVLSHEPVDAEFIVPEIGVQEDEEFKAPLIEIETTEKIEYTTVVSQPEKISINQVNSRKYNFHYRIEDNRLFLYGKFDNSPYEIIEVNTPSDKKIYFYYNGDFFHLRKGASAVTRLSKIENSSLIDRLAELKNGYLD